MIKNGKVALPLLTQMSNSTVSYCEISVSVVLSRSSRRWSHVLLPALL